MRIIDLLNKIANGEELPRSIFYEGEDFVFNCDENTYVCCDHDLTPLFSEYNMKKEKFLNDEVEITDGVCERCGTTKNVSYVIDPYDEEINDIQRWCYLCPECYEEYLDDI